MASHIVPAIAAEASHHLPAATTNLAMVPDNAAISAAAGLSKPKFIFWPPEKQNCSFQCYRNFPQATWDESWSIFEEESPYPEQWLEVNSKHLYSFLIGTAYPPGGMIQ